MDAFAPLVNTGVITLLIVSLPVESNTKVFSSDVDVTKFPFTFERIYTPAPPVDAFETPSITPEAPVEGCVNIFPLTELILKVIVESFSSCPAVTWATVRCVKNLISNL